MSKNIMNGGYSEQDARNLLLIRGIEYVKGIVPHKAPKNANLAEFDDSPQFWIDGVKQIEARQYNLDLHTHVRVGCISEVSIQSDVRLCWDCYYALFVYVRALSESLVFRGNVREHYCELCGKWENDDIPF